MPAEEDEARSRERLKSPDTRDFGGLPLFLGAAAVLSTRSIVLRVMGKGERGKLGLRDCLGQESGDFRLLCAVVGFIKSLSYSTYLL